MMMLCGQVNRVWHYWAGRYPGSVGVLISPSYLHRVPIDPWMPFALDNDAFTAWKNGIEWDVEAWRSMLSKIKMTGQDPMWAAVPDSVGNKDETLRLWKKHVREILNLGWKAAFCVQDGMSFRDVPNEASVVFVGGTDKFKFPSLNQWTENFGIVHCARVNAPEMFEACERAGCVSIDGTGWFRDPSRQDKLPAVQRFIEGYRNQTPFLCPTTNPYTTPITL